MSNSILRNEFYSKHADFHHTFDDGEYYLEYGLYGSVPLDKRLHEEIIVASERLWNILQTVKDKIKTLSTEELLGLGYDERIIPFLHLDPLTSCSVTSRFDIIRTRNSFKFIELNNDTPFLIMENYKMDDLLNASLGLTSCYPRRRELLVSSMMQSLEDSARHVGKPLQDCTIAVMGYDYEEDLEEFTTLTFYQDTIRRMGLNCHYVHYNEVHVDMDMQDILSEKTGTIDILLKFAYPYEFLVNDQYANKEGYIGLDMLKLMEQGKVALLNPPASHILQNKGVFAYVFHLLDNTNFFSYDDKSFLRKYLPYTSFTDAKFQQKGVTYVKKPVISREGQSVEIISPNKTVKSSLNLYDNELAIYQEHLPLPTRTVIVEDEEEELHEILGVFIAGNKYSGTVCRLGGVITDWYSYWIATHEV